MSDDFTKVVCWQTAEINRVLTDDVAALSDAMLLATHQPAKIRKRRLGDPGEGIPVDEEALLTEFLQPGADRVLMPIIGEPGTGKSRLVRWLRARVPERSDRRVIYVHKHHTSLRDVILLVLDQMENEHAAPLRRALDDARESLRPAELPSDLLNKLATILEYREELWGSPDDTQYRARKAAARRFPQVLQDAAYRKWFLKENGVIAGFVKNAMEGSRPGDLHREFRFTLDDLPPRVPGDERPREEVLDYYDQLNSVEKNKQAAADLLTDALGPAIQEIFGVTGAASLLEVMRKTRRVLAAQSAELVILVEDFAKIQGIQRDLLEALVEPAVVEDVRLLCPIRVALAVTSGYFTPLQDTFRSRAGFNSHEYVLDAPYGESEGSQTWSRQEVTEFVGRYLNAVRVGTTNIGEDFDTADPDSRLEGNWVRGACKRCDYRPACFNSFGSVLGADRGDDDAFGLYPFNEKALDVLTRSTLKREPDGTERFDPRTLLGGVVKFTVDQYAEPISDGTFPPASYVDEFSHGNYPLPNTDLDLLGRLDQHDPSGRTAAVVRIWGAGESVVSPGVYEAFDLVPYTEGAISPSPPNAPPEPPQRGAAPRDPIPASEPTELEHALDTLTGWAQGAITIDSVLTGKIRSLLHSAVVQRVDWDRLGLAPAPAFLVDSSSGVVLRPGSFDVKRVETARRFHPNNLEFTIEADLEGAQFLRAVLRLTHYKHLRYPAATEDYRRFRLTIDPWAAAVALRCTEVVNGQESPLIAPIQALLVGARLLGLPHATSNDSFELLNVCFTEALSKRTPSSDVWSVLRTGASENRAAMQEQVLALVGLRQGTTGAPVGINATVLLTLVEALQGSWTISGPTEAMPREAARHVKDLVRRLDVALQDERKYLVEWHTTVVPLIGTSSRDEVLQRVLAAADAAIAASVFEPAADYQPFRLSHEKASGVSWSLIDDVGQLIANLDALDRGALLSALGVDRHSAMATVLEFLKRAEKVLFRSSQKASIVRAQAAAGQADGDPLAHTTAAMAALDRVMQKMEAGR